MLLNSIKEMNRLRKEINRLLCNEVSNIYLKVTTKEKNWRSQNLDFLCLEKLSTCQFLEAPAHEGIIGF